MYSKIKKHYHWIIAAVAILQLLIYGGVVNNLSNYHMIPVSESLNITRTAFSVACSIRAAVCMLSALVCGVILRRFGFRKAVTVGLAISALFYGSMAAVDSYGMLLVVLAGSGLADGLCFTAGVSSLLNGWFHKHRGLVLGMVTAASGVGSTVLGAVQSAAIEHVSWRLSFGFAGAVLLLMALLVGLLIRNAPGDMGLRPYGEEEARKGEKKKNTHWDGFTMAQLKKLPAFYLLLVCTLLTCLCMVLVSYNIVPYLQDAGMSESRARSLFSTMMLVLGIVKLLIGVICDRIGARKAILICLGSCAVGVSLLMTLPKNEFAMLGALMVFVFMMPVTTMMFPLLSVELFGYRAQGQYIGLLMAVVSASSIIAGPVANLVYDRLGSYEPVFWTSVVLSLVLCGVYPVLFAMVRRERKKLENA